MMKRQQWLRNQRGSSLIITAFGTIALLAMLAAVINFGYLTYNKTQLQNAADAAALAGGHVLAANPGSPSCQASAKQKAFDLVKANAPDITAAKESVSIVPGDPNGNTLKVIVTVSRTVHGAMFSKEVGATATAQLFVATGINSSPNVVIPLDEATALLSNPNIQYSMVMKNPLSTHYQEELAIPNSFDYSDVVYTSDWQKAESTYLNDCRYSKDGCNLSTHLYNWAPSCADVDAINATSQRVQDSRDQADDLYGKGNYPKWNDSTQQYEPPVAAGDKRIMAFPVVASMPDKNIPEMEAKDIPDNLKIQGFVAFVIDSVDTGNTIEYIPQNQRGTWYNVNGRKDIPAYPLHQIKGHFIRLTVTGNGVDPNANIFNGLAPISVMLVKNDHPENDY